jgi:hypothetical protein
MPLVHDELQRIVRRYLHGERAHHSLQEAELVNEAFLRLVDVQQADWQTRTHFLAMSARFRPGDAKAGIDREAGRDA